MHRTIPNRPGRRRWGCALAAAVVAVCALPAGASASTIGFNSDEVLLQGSGEEINIAGVRQVAGALVVTDSAGLFHSPNLAVPNRCASIDRQTMRCPLKRFEARMGNGDDVAGPIDTHVPVEINGQEGNDLFQAGNPSFLTSVEFVGGSDVDIATYAASAGASGGRGVRIANDGQPNDGRPGLDTDNIGRDVEHIIGSTLADEITAHSPANLEGTGSYLFVSGGQGNDVLRGGSGNRVRFKTGPVADGADKIIGGQVFTEVSYNERTRPVRATLNIGGADDGEAGEGDEIIGHHEVIIGGKAGDTLAAPFGSTAPHVIFGEGGDDIIDGAEGADELVGGSGDDHIRALGGTDRVVAKDGQRDRVVDCGSGTDTVTVDGIDGDIGCENGTIGVLRLAPRALRAEAGRTAKLKLSWRHPSGWRQLRSVTLRVYRGKARVGAVAIKPRGRRIEARGAVKVLHPTRLARRKKTVSAQLALRLDRKLAGRQLRLEVEAVDVRGARQLERGAGSIRVTAPLLD